MPTHANPVPTASAPSAPCAEAMRSHGGGDGALAWGVRWSARVRTSGLAKPLRWHGVEVGGGRSGGRSPPGPCAQREIRGQQCAQCAKKVMIESVKKGPS